MLKYKDQITNYCSLAIILSGVEASLSKQGVIVSAVADHTAIAVAALALGLIGWLTGKPSTPAQ